MEDLLHSRFIQTALSADSDIEPTEAMEYYHEFYMVATSLLSGDFTIKNNFDETGFIKVTI